MSRSLTREQPRDFLLPFLRLPSIRFVLGMTTDDGSILYSEDLLARQFTRVGAPTFGAADNGIAYATFTGSGQALTTPDAAWNKLTTALTAIAILRVSATGGVQGIIAKHVASNFQFYLSINNGQARIDISADGTTLVSKTRGSAMALNKWLMVVARYIPSTSLTIWDTSVSVAGSSNTTSIPAALFNGAASLDIGRLSGSSNYIGFPSSVASPADVAFAGLYGAALSDNTISWLINYARRLGMA